MIYVVVVCKQVKPGKPAARVLKENQEIKYLVGLFLPT